MAREPRIPKRKPDQRPGSRHVSHKLVAYVPTALRDRLLAWVDSDQHDARPTIGAVVRVFLEESLSRRGY